MEPEVQSCRRHWLHVCEGSLNFRQKNTESMRRYNFSALTIGQDEIIVTPQTEVCSLIFINVCMYMYVHVCTTIFDTF